MRVPLDAVTVGVRFKRIASSCKYELSSENVFLGLPSLFRVLISMTPSAFFQVALMVIPLRSAYVGDFTIVPKLTLSFCTRRSLEYLQYK